ncbi:MAG: hypothetical protein C4344_01370 [Acidimicrobiia bacterium]
MLTSTVSTPLYGKVSDLWGRKPVFQAAIAIFLVGSALSGLSRNMSEPIAFRAVQGIGAGGLQALAFAIIGDIVAPRERGRYQGYIGSTFALASIAGPLLGGFFVDHLSWRWVFYVNLPVGAVALVITSAVLNLAFRRVEHRIDHTGAGLLVADTSCLLLVTVWGRPGIPVDVRDHRGARRGGPRAARAVRGTRAAGFRTDPSHAAVSRHRLQRLGRVPFRHRDRHVRRDRVRAALPPGGRRGQPDALGPSHEPDDARGAHHGHRHGTAHDPIRALQGLPPRRHSNDGPRCVSPLDARHEQLLRRRDPRHRGHGHRHGHGDPRLRSGGAELGGPA